MKIRKNGFNEVRVHKEDLRFLEELTTSYVGILAFEFRGKKVLFFNTCDVFFGGVVVGEKDSLIESHSDKNIVLEKLRCYVNLISN